MPKMITEAQAAGNLADLNWQRHQTWEVSRKGNWWRKFKGLTLSVFERPPGSDWFLYSVADKNGPKYSQRAYHGLEVALKACEKAADAPLAARPAEPG